MSFTISLARPLKVSLLTPTLQANPSFLILSLKPSFFCPTYKLISLIRSNANSIMLPPETSASAADLIMEKALVRV